jgi:alkylation response protein AidB-like acyl-CoA dehydrogenase
LDLLPSSEQREIISSAASFLAAKLPVTRTRALMDSPSNVDEQAWSAAADLGWFALGLPESEGGVGCGLADEAVLFREIGRSLASGPFLAAVLAARVASFAGRPELTAEIVGGRKVGLMVPGRSTVLEGSEISGEVQVLDGVGADLVLLALPDRASLFEVGALGELSPIGCIDPASRLGRVPTAGATPIATVSAELDPVERRGSVLVAALQTGVAEATRDIAAEHAKSRVQFGRPIGVNQGVKHPCAEMAVKSELAWAQTVVAALALDEGREDAEYQALSAKVVAGHAAEQNAAATVQVLGGMGFTFEHDANLYMKRAYVLDYVLGDERETLSRLIELPAAA